MIDFDALLNGPLISAFGALVLYERPGEPEFLLPAIFRRAHVEVFGDDGAPHSTNSVSLDVQLTAFPAGCMPTQGDRVQVALRGEMHVDAGGAPDSRMTLQSFEVMDVRRADSGWAMLPLTARVPDDLA